jgi:hypothetical protein
MRENMALKMVIVMTAKPRIGESRKFVHKSVSKQKLNLIELRKEKELRRNANK